MRRRLFCLLLALLVLPTAVARAATGPALAVDGAAGRHAINPGIYGLNFADATEAAQLALPLDRWGGNTTDTYNWQLGSDNTGNDWYFENIADCFGVTSCNAPYFGYRAFVEKDRSVGAKTLFTLPLMGEVAKDAPTQHPFTCGFPKTVFPTQDKSDNWDPNCGDGLSGGQPLAADPSRDGTPVGASFDGGLVADMVSRYGTAAHGGVAYYELGNEPGLWDSTHRDMHPQPTSYDELWQKSRDAAIAVKQADPSAGVLGFSEWGWPNYFCSGLDLALPNASCDASSPDRAAHGGEPLAEWLLDQFHAYDEQHGERLLDYLDLHYYAQDGSTTDVTRSLWDPTYTDPSWINTQIDLIPRMRAWVAAHYPGTGLSLSEYNLSVSSDPVVNALIQADTLGIFAREGLDLATRWALPDVDGADIEDAFLMFRNYDGQHHTFGDTYVQSSSADQSQLAVYAAQRSDDGAYTVLVVNKTAGALTSPLALSGVTLTGTPQAWQWTGGAIARVADPPPSLTLTYPARSLTLLVLPSDVPPAGAGGGGGGGDSGAGPGAGGSSPAHCVVPALRGHTLGAVRRMLRAARCRLGVVHRPRHVGAHRVLRVFSQRPAARRRLAVGARVSVWSRA
jgi:hypothetical protein